MNKIITTTTDHLEGWEVTQYFSPISTNIVIGANILSEIAASWTDIFGGRSGSYERRLQEVYSQATDTLKRKAKALGANCVLGLRIDTGEVSGKGTQMFMISAVGTPVVAVRVKPAAVNSIDEGFRSEVEGALVDRIFRANNIIEEWKRDPHIQVGPSTIEFIVESKLPALAEIVLKLLSKVDTDVDPEEKYNRLSVYFARLSPDETTQIIYDYLLANEVNSVFRARLIKILVSNNLIRYDRVQELLKSNDLNSKKAALELLAVPKDTYTREDVSELKDILNFIPDAFPATHVVDEVKGVFSRNAKEVWVCNCGTKNRAEIEYCTNCNNDKLGFDQNERKPLYILYLLTARIEIIERLLSN